MVAKRAIQKATAERRGTAFVRVRMRTGDGLSPVPHSFALLLGAARAIASERLTCGGGDIGRDDPCGVLVLDCTRMVLAKVRTKDFAVLGQTDLACEFLRRVRFRVRHVCPFVRIRSIDRIHSMPHRTHMCCKHFVNVRGGSQTIDVCNRSNAQRMRARVACVDNVVVLRNVTTRTLPTCEGGIDVGFVARGAKREHRALFHRGHIHVSRSTKEALCQSS